MSVYSIDIDGTLTTESAWTEEECLTVKPNIQNIEKVNELYKKHFIVIHTARRHELYLNTIRWLEMNGVRYHAVRFEKMPADFIFDIDAITDADFLELNKPIKYEVKK